MLSSTPLPQSYFGESKSSFNALQLKRRRRKSRFLLSSSVLLLLGSVLIWNPAPSRKLFTFPLITASDSKKKSNGPAFNQFNPNQAWCPSAVCHNSPLCEPCNRRYLFLLGPGRTGSTTLLTMFNLLPGVRLAGENFGELNLAEDLLSIFWDQSPTSNFVYDKPVEYGPFRHNAIPTGAMSCVAQRLLYTLDPPPMDVMKETTIYPTIESYDSDTILGLKTIRAYRSDWTSHDVAEYFKENFPCARYIFHKRSDTHEHALSMQKEFNRNYTVEEWKDSIQEEMDFYESLLEELGPERATMVDLQEWKSDISILNRVLKWLGFPNCRFDSILHDNNQGYDPDHAHHVHLGAHCKAI